MQPMLQTSITLAILVSSLYVFTRGFFLTRYELEHAVSECSNLGQSSTACFATGIVEQPPVTTLLLVIIDALRFDYLYYNTSEGFIPNPYYSNQLSSVHHASAAHSRIYRQYVDPPTVTMQRLKGLTTGTLPTFIDVRQNFDFDIHLQEDHWLRQVRRVQPSRVVHMGDDTWLSLFQRNTTFTSSFAYPSFNVKDLHTVDDGVLSHIYEELESMQRAAAAAADGGVERNVLIAHFLGVDHVGHHYGPNHPEMTSKLHQMDDMLSAVMQFVDRIPHSMLMVLGDHGMTEDGNHGGATSEETDAALFVYAHDELPAQSEVDEVVQINQIDLVPTISYLLGVPIPYSSLGKMVTSLVTPKHQLHALRVNAHQIARYLRHYQRHAHSFNDATLEQLEQRLAVLDASDTADTAPLQQAYTHWLLDATSMCRREWTTFGLPSMLLGIAGLIAAVVWAVLSMDRAGNAIQHGTVTITVGPQRQTLMTVHAAASLGNAVTIMSLAAYYQGLFTNSFTIVDPAVQRTVLTALVVAGAAITFAKAPSVGTNSILSTACLLVTVRSFNLDNTMTSDMTLSRAFFSSAHIVQMVLALALWTTGFMYVYRQSPTTAPLPSLLPVLGAPAVLTYWSLPHPSDLVRLYIPNMLYLAFILPCLHSCFTGAARNWRVQPASQPSANQPSSNGTAVDAGTTLASPPSAASVQQQLLYLFGAAALCYMLLLGPLSSIVLLQYSAAAWLICRLHQQCSLPSTLIALLLWMLSNLLWYSTNHRADFARLHVSCSFVGWDVFSYYPAGALLLYNTFGHVILTALLAAIVQSTYPMSPQRSARPSIFSSLILLYLVRALCGVINVTIQRRHLMVWALFAPKMLFDSIEAVMAIAALAACQLMTAQTTASPSKARQHRL